MTMSAGVLSTLVQRAGREAVRRDLLRVTPSCAARGEEVDEQLVDALGLVVVDPVRRVGQALDAVEVRHVLRVRFRQIRTEVAVLLAPDDEGRGRDRDGSSSSPFGGRTAAR